MSIAPNLTSVWLNSISGQYLQLKEQVMYDQAVFDLFGFNAVQISCLQMDLLRNSRIPNRYKSSEFVVTSLADKVFEHNLNCSDDFLPFSDMSIDLLLLPHRLEFSERPHQTLREAARVMMPDGHLLISGFNPFSFWGAKASLDILFSKQTSYPWTGKFIGINRLKDWLALLGFEIILVEMCCHVPPFEQLRWHKRFSFMDKIGGNYCTRFGGVYFVVAKKRIVGMTAIKPSWKIAPLKSPLIGVQPKSNPSQSKPAQSELSDKDTSFNSS
ncbi:MAG: methyltransferase domain-containing protein [Methylotenera sp.]|nr:methyltransferase domain-containing protein [Methylotenera sp.]